MGAHSGRRRPAPRRRGSRAILRSGWKGSQSRGSCALDSTSAPTRPELSVHGRNRGRLVARGDEGVRHRPRGLFPGPAHLQAGAVRRQPHTEERLPARDLGLYFDRRPLLAARDHARLPDGTRRRPGGAQARLSLVRHGQMAGARSRLRRAGDEVQLCLVLGLGGVENDARRDGSRQVEGRLRVPLDPQFEPLQRTACRR